jgi:hypothetical protein
MKPVPFALKSALPTVLPTVLPTFLLAVIAAGLSAASWDYRPLVSYDDETVRAVLRSEGDAASWTVTGPPDLSLQRDADTVAMDWIPGAEVVLALQREGKPTLRLRSAVPGRAAEFHISDDGFLTLSGDPAVLALSRVEARSDRRWQLISAMAGETITPCAEIVAAPSVVDGRSALLTQCELAQAVHSTSHGVLLEVAASERLVGWKHREFRQVLAWLVADLQARNAGFVVVVMPHAAEPLDAELEPIRQQIADVALAYRCRVIDAVGLRDPNCWTIAGEVLGSTLNAHGSSVRDAFLKPWLAP